MNRLLLRIAGAATLLIALSSGASAQKAGGILKMPDFASPASMSIHEEITRAAINALMPVFNNLVLFDQHKAQNTIDTIVPDLAESWSWDETKTALTFKLRHSVKWCPVHLGRREMHLGPVAGKGGREIPPQPA